MNFQQSTDLFVIFVLWPEDKHHSPHENINICKVKWEWISENGEWFTPSPEVPSNHRGTYKEHGEWAFPVYPTSRSIQGSPPTPYIYDDRCAWEDVTERLFEVYNLGRKTRKKAGLKGREWAISDEAGFTAQHQGDRVMEAFNTLFNTWKPREKYEIVNATEHNGNFLSHKIIY